MRLFHSTPRYNRYSIEEHGLLPAYSQGKRQAVWLHTEERTAWAFLHCVRRHGCQVEDVIVFEVEVDEKLVKRSSVDQLFYIESVVEPGYIRGVRGFQIVSESPIKE